MKSSIYLIILITFIFLSQVMIAERSLFGDDYIFAGLAEENRFFFRENGHPPLPVWSDILITEIFSLTNKTMRLTSIIFATLSISLVYFLARKINGQKAAWIAALLVGFSAWHIRASQMNSGSDGGMFTFFFYCTIYFFVMFLETNQTKDKIATGIAFGLTMLSKETGVLLILICGLYYGYTIWKRMKEAKENASIKEEVINGIKNSAIICLIALVVWSIFPILDIIYNNSQNTDAIISRIKDVVIERESTTDYSYWFMTVFSIFKLLLWTGPLLLFFPLLSMMTKKEWKQEGIFMLLIIVSVLFYFIITPPNLDRTRYLMITIPSLAILSAKYIATKVEEYEFGKKEWLFVGVCSVMMFIAFVFINQNNVIVSYESIKNPIYQLSNLNINFSLPIFTETDNSGFVLNFAIVFITFISSTTLFICLIFTKNKKTASFLFILFISIGIGYNFIIAEEYAFHLTSPNYSDGIKELSNYAMNNKLNEPIYLLKNYELQYYLRHNYDNFITSYGISETNLNNIEDFRISLESAGGTIIFTDMPFIAREGELWHTITASCSKDFVVEDKGIEIGYVFSC